METVFDLVSWESVLFLLSLTRTVMIVDDNVSSIDITIIYIYIYISGMLVNIFPMRILFYRSESRYVRLLNEKQDEKR